MALYFCSRYAFLVTFCFIIQITLQFFVIHLLNGKDGVPEAHWTGRQLVHNYTSFLTEKNGMKLNYFICTENLHEHSIGYFVLYDLFWLTLCLVFLEAWESSWTT